MPTLPVSSQDVSQEVYPREDTVYIPTWSEFASPDNFNPYLSGSEGHQKGVWALYEHLFTFNLANGSIIPHLATGYEYGIDFKSIKIFIRHGVTWNDGYPFTANDVVFTLNMMKTYFGGWATKWIEDTVAIDNYTVMIWLNEPNARFHWELTSVICYSNIWIVPEHIWKDVDPTTFMNNPPVWTGPYNLEGVSSTAVVYKRNDDYWGIEVMGWVPQPEYIIWKFVGASQDKVTMALENNELDIGWMGVPEFLDVQKRDPHISRWTVMQPAVLNLHLNIHKYPLSLPEVRWAISDGIDRTGWLELGGGAAAGTMATSLFPEYSNIQAFIDPEILKEYDVTVYSPEEAIAALEGLGFTRGTDGIFVTPNGTRLSFEILVTGVSPQYQFFAENMKAIGIDVILKVVDYSIWWESYLKLDYDFLMTGRYLCAVSPYEIYKTFDSSLVLPWGPDGVKSDPTTNIVRYSNAEYDQILKSVAEMTDEDPKAEGLYNKLLTILMRDLPVIPLTIGYDSEVTNDYYWTNWPSSQGGSNPYTVLLTWWSQFTFTTFNIRSRTLPAKVAPTPSPTISPEMQLVVDYLKSLIDKTATGISIGDLEGEVAQVAGTVDTLTMAVYISVILSLIAAVAAIIAMIRTGRSQ
jgi:peptide/nickel transport system substrate-binding protein